MAETLLASQLLKTCARRRRQIQEMETQMFFKKQNQSRKRFLVEMDEELDMAEALGLCAVASKKERKERTQDEPSWRDSSWWRNGYRNWDDKAFKKRLRTNRATFNFILGEIRDQLVKEPTRFKPEPIPPDTQLAICLYRLAHGCTYSTVGDLFGVAESTASVIFNQALQLHADLSVYPKFWGR